MTDQLKDNSAHELTPGKRWRAWEDYVEGTVSVFGTYDVTEQEVIAFATAYDPQGFHIDPAAAAVGEYGGIIASGWHTAAMTMRLLVDNYLAPGASIGSPGIDEIRWTAPVRPGDRLHIRVTVREVRQSRSKPDRGVVITFTETFTDDNVLVMSVKSVSIILTRSGLIERALDRTIGPAE